MNVFACHCQPVKLGQELYRRLVLSEAIPRVERPKVLQRGGLECATPAARRLCKIVQAASCTLAAEELGSVESRHRHQSP